MASGQILVVEDSRLVATRLCKTLTKLDYVAVAVVDSGEAAMQQAVQLAPDLVLMDINLAGKIDGIEAARQIRAQLDVPIIYLTANTDEAVLQRAKLTEPSSYLVKPVREKELHAAIEMTLYRHRSETQHKEAERKQAEEAMRRLVSGTSSAVGPAFFETLVRELAGWLKVRWALVSEIEPDAPERASPLAFWNDGPSIAAEAFDLAGSPCGQVAHGGFRVFPADLQAMFPDSQAAHALGATWYAGIPLLDGDGRVVGVLCAMHSHNVHLPPNIAEVFSIFSHRAGAEIMRCRAEKHLRQSLQEKESLLKEIHHRVKNNLQVVVSLLHLQAGRIQDEQVLKVFRDSQSRIRSMALVHEKLYQSPSLSKVDYAAYIRQLATSLFRIHQIDPAAVALRIEAQDIFLDIDLAIPCGLIINELVVNCLKHAFPPGQVGEVKVKMHAQDDRLVLVVSDNGVGLPEELDVYATNSLGMELVNVLTKQLDGTMTVERAGGTTFTVAFPFAPSDQESKSR